MTFFLRLQKANPYHDERGRFTFAPFDGRAGAGAPSEFDVSLFPPHTPIGEATMAGAKHLLAVTGLSPRTFGSVLFGRVPLPASDERYVVNLPAGAVPEYNHRFTSVFEDADGNRATMVLAALVHKDTKRGIDNLYVSHVEVSPEIQGHGIAKGLMAGIFSRMEDGTIREVSLMANIDAGAYAWARFGFLPDKNGWSHLRAQLHGRLKRIQGFGHAGKALVAKVKKVLESDDPRALWVLADMRDRLKGGRNQYIGQALLYDLAWMGTLSGRNREQMARLKSYLRGD